VAITRGNNRQQHAGFERNQKLYGDGQSNNQPGGWFGDGFERADEPGGDGRSGAGLHVMGLDESHELAGLLLTSNSPVTPVTLVDTDFSANPVRFYCIQLGP
jgi:hypothetical protein